MILHTNKYPSRSDVIRYDTIHLYVDDEKNFLDKATKLFYTKLPFTLRHHTSLFAHINGFGCRAVSGWIIEGE